MSRDIKWHKKLSESQLKRWNSLAGKELKEKLKNKMMGKNNPIAKKCKCIELDIIFDSYADACEYINQKRSYSGKIGLVIQGKRKTFAGYHWEAVDETL